jgi:DamX protein
MPVEVAEVPLEQQPVSTDDEVAVVDEPVMVDEVTASEPEENSDLVQQAPDAAPEVGGEDEARTAAEFESEQSGDATAATETEDAETSGESPTAVAEAKQELELLPAAGLLEAVSVKDKKGDTPAQASEPFRRDAWLKSQKPDAYAIQMLGVGRLESLLEFVRRHGLEERAIYFESRRNNKPWHVLLWGVYPDRKSAKAAQAELPASLRRKTLWIRGLGSIQSSMLESPR